MTLRQAQSELRANVNTGSSHAVLLRSGRSWRTELHAGYAGNCCCDDNEDYIWREAGPYTYPREIAAIK